MPSCSQRVGTPNSRHNLDNNYRKFLDHVDESLSQHNEIIQHKSIEEIYAEHLQPSFEAFNDKQKRKDRRLDVKWNCSDALGYQRALDKAAKESDNHKLRESGRPPIREIVWQIGNPEQGYGSAGQTIESREKIKGMLLEVQAEAEARYPNFAWGDIVFHADEVSFDAEGKEMGSIHLHSSFVPLCFENKQGMSVQVAFERSLKEMGFSSFEAWKHDLENIMEQVLERHGLERTVMNNHEEHQTSKEFHKQQQLIKETKELESKTVELSEKVNDLEGLAKTMEAKTEGLLNTKQKVQQEAQKVYKTLQEVREKVSSTTEELGDLKEEVEIYQDAIEKNQEIAEIYKNQAVENLEEVQDLEARKTALKGEIKALDIKKEELDGELLKKRGEKEKMERELPALRAQISEAETELEATQKAVKELKNENEGLFTHDSLQQKIAKIRKEDEDKRRLSMYDKVMDMFPEVAAMVRRCMEQLERASRTNRKHEKSNAFKIRD